LSRGSLWYVKAAPFAKIYIQFGRGDCIGLSLVRCIEIDTKILAYGTQLVVGEIEAGAG
jgi:hypothetical protein